MKKINKNWIVSLIMLGVFSLSGLSGPSTALAADAPDLGVASGYSVFGNAGITETPAQASHLWGNAGGNGFGHASLISSQVDGSIDAGANAPVVGAISAAYGDLAGQAQTGAIDLASSPSVAPGVYDVAATAFNSTLTLDGAGIYIFRSTSSIAQTAGGTMNLTNGATACNVFWQIPTSMTFAAAGNIEGTIITNTGLISFASGVNLKGRAWAATQVTMDNNQITEPTCAAPTGTINVVKTVINDHGGTNVVADFQLFVGGSPVVSGVTNAFPATASYSVTETGNSNYAQAFSGDCDSNGNINLAPGDSKFCIITNDDIEPQVGGGAPPSPPIPPLISVLKVPAPLSLPNGPGSVTYTYTVRNIGTVPMSNVTMVGDTCSPIVLVSGDAFGDSILDLNEIWTYTCSTNLTETHTNTIVATGWANGISAVDIANATVVVGVPGLPETGVVPPLIHIVKKPSALILPQSGPVTYTFTVTNPGVVALSNVSVYDNKCSPTSTHSGDVNSNNMLDVSETWVYSCQTNLASNTVNTATATGMANGLTATDFSVATVLVTPPGFPDTGVAPDKQNNVWAILMLAGIFTALILVRRKQTS